MMLHRRRVLHVFGRMDRGGAEIRTIELMNQAALGDVDFHFVTLGAGPGALDTKIIELNGQIHPCRLNYGFPTRFRRLLRHGRYDIVHSHVHYFSGFILRLARAEKIASRIAHFRSTGDGQPESVRRRVQRAVMRHWIRRHATAIVGVSDGVLRSAWGGNWRDEPRCTVIYNGIDLRRFLGDADRLGVRREFGLPDDTDLIIHVGTVSRTKNQERVIRIFEALLRRRPCSRLLLVGRDGDGTLEVIRSRLSVAGLKGSIVIAGEREDVPRLLKASDLMLFPSVREGLPGAVLEACAAGVPVLATALPGVQEISAACEYVKGIIADAPDSDWIAAAEAMLQCRPPHKEMRGSDFDVSTAASRLRVLYGCS